MNQRFSEHRDKLKIYYRLCHCEAQLCSNLTNFSIYAIIYFRKEGQEMFLCQKVVREAVRKYIKENGSFVHPTPLLDWLDKELCVAEYNLNDVGSVLTGLIKSGEIVLRIDRLFAADIHFRKTDRLARIKRMRENLFLTSKRISYWIRSRPFLRKFFFPISI